MKLPHIALVILLSFIVALVTVKFVASHNSGSTISSESTYARILRTGTIRCGYTSWNPLFFIDASSGEKKGIFHDAMEEVGNRLGLKISWQEELGWGSVVEALKTGRVDMACSGYWLNPPRIKNLSSSAAQLYTPLYAWGRKNDPRQYNNLNDLNSEQLTVASLDGSAENQIVNSKFSKIKHLALPELDSNADEIESLLTNKADFIVLDSATTDSYTAKNPDKIRNLLPNEPLVVFPNVMLLPPNELQLKEMIDDTLHNIEYDGTLDAILKTYHEENTFLRNSKPIAFK